MQIKINNHLINCQILPVDKPTLDETLETFSFALLMSSNPMPFAPCQSVQVITDNNETINLFLVSDSVEVYSISPTKWKHSISCVQNTRKLSKHLVRNSVFTTPPYLEKKSYSAITCSLPIWDTSAASGGHFYGFASHGIDVKCVDNYICEKAELRTINNFAREKVKNSYFRLKCQCVYAECYDYKNKHPQFTNVEWVDDWESAEQILDTLTSYEEGFGFNDALVLHYKDSNNVEHQETISSSYFGDGAWYPINQKVKYERIKELADDGCTSFWIEFSGTLVSGTVGFWSDEPSLMPVRFFPLFTFQVEIILETYYYNCYEILSLLAERQRKAREIGNSGDTHFAENLLFNLHDSGELYDLLVSTPAPNFTFTQCTMYECVAEVFRIFDAIFTMDSNNYLGIEYFNESNKRDITSTLKKVSQNSSSSEDRYTNGLVSYFQNAKVIETFPSDTSFNDYATIKTKELAIPASNNSFIFETPHNIDTILEAYFHLIWKHGSSYYQPMVRINTAIEDNSIGGGGTFNEYWSLYSQIDNMDIDITHFLVDENLWTILDAGADYYENDIYVSSTLKQVNTIFFTKGTNRIDVSYNYEKYWWGSIQYAVLNMIDCALLRMFGVKVSNKHADKTDVLVYLENWSDFTWDQIKLKTKYVTEIDGRVKIEGFKRKYDGETLIDQYNGGVDLNKMGLNILGLTLKLGNPTLSVTQQITTWENRVKQGDLYNYQGKPWIANTVAYTILGDGKIQANIEFVQNFNELSLRTKLLREKRMSNISNELTLKSEENINEYIYVDFATTSTFITTNDISIKSTALQNGLFCSLGRPANVMFEGFDIATIKPNNVESTFYIPLIKYGAGNSICFEMSYSDPMSAGKQTIINSSGWYVESYFTKNINYTNEFGEFESATINIFARSNVTINHNYPVVTTSNEPSINIRNLKYHKQSNEIFALNYEMVFLPRNDVFIGSKFINNNAFIDGSYRTLSDLTLYYSNTDFKYSVLDTKGEGSSVEIVAIDSPAIVNRRIEVRFTLASSIQAKSFALCEKDGTLLFAANKTINGNQVSLFFDTQNHRTDDHILPSYSG